MSVSDDTMERIVPEAMAAHDATGRETLELHLERYRFAAQHARAGRALDIACGVGYGTRLIAEHNGNVLEAIGVDIDAGAVAYATEHYASGRVAFLQGDALTFSDGTGFDTIVSLETIEHVANPVAVLAKLIQLLKPGSVLIASVPTTPSTDVNPHHLHDFTERSFRTMMRRLELRELASLRQIQRYPLLAAVTRSEKRMQNMRENLLGYYLRHPSAGVRRALATARYGFTNRYLTSVWSRIDD